MFLMFQIFFYTYIYKETMTMTMKYKFITHENIIFLETLKHKFKLKQINQVNMKTKKLIQIFDTADKVSWIEFNNKKITFKVSYTNDYYLIKTRND